MDAEKITFVAALAEAEFDVCNGCRISGIFAAAEIINLIFWIL